MVRTNTAALPIDSAPSNMAEVYLPPLLATLTTPAPGVERVYVTIKQPVARCSQTPFKSMTSQKIQSYLCCQHEPGRCFLKEPHLCLLPANKT